MIEALGLGPAVQNQILGILTTKNYTAAGFTASLLKNLMEILALIWFHL